MKILNYILILKAVDYNLYELLSRILKNSITITILSNYIVKYYHMLLTAGKIML